MSKQYPTPQEILRARNDARITQTQAAALVQSSLRAWQKWEAGDARMDPIKFQMFKLKVKDAQ